MTTGCFLTVKDPLGKSSIPSKGALAVVITVITEIPPHCPPHPVESGACNILQDGAIVQLMGRQMQ